jgi:tetratricopeptide (TPR) repeat protein
MSRSASTKPPLTKSTVSKDGGKFAFAFLDKQPGQTVHLRVNKEGYVVVNDVQLEVVIPANPDAKLLKVILCPEDEREKWAGLLYRVTSNKAIENAVQECLFTAQLVTVQFRFEDAEKAYLQAIDAESDSFEANFAYAGFSQNLNRFEQAKAAYGRCLEWARKKGKDEELAATLNNLGVLDSDQGRMKEARKEYAEALQIRRELAQKNPETHQPDVAATLGAIPPGALSVAAVRSDARPRRVLFPSRLFIPTAGARGFLPAPRWKGPSLWRKPTRTPDITDGR